MEGSLVETNHGARFHINKNMNFVWVGGEGEVGGGSKRVLLTFTVLGIIYFQNFQFYKFQVVSNISYDPLLYLICTSSSMDVDVLQKSNYIVVYPPDAIGYINIAI